jgi:integrase
MPRPNPGPQLRLYGPDKRYGAKPKKGLKQYIWYVVWSEGGDKGEASTGACHEDRGAAEEWFGDWLAGRALKWGGARRPDQVSVSDVLSLYAEERAPDTIDSKRIGFALAALLPWWGEQMLSSITSNTCRGYVKSRLAQGRSQGTARRELGTLTAAINYAYGEGKLTQPVPVELPDKTPSKDIWLSRSEIALLVHAARSEPKAKAHLPYFILVGFYMGRRKQAILKLQWQPNTVAGHVDLGARRIDFQGRRAESKKRKGRAEIPRHLLTFLRYLRRRTRQYVLEYEGKPLANLKRSFATACEAAAAMAESNAAKAQTPATRDEWLVSAYRFRKASPHTLRHSCASWLVQRGIPFADVGQFIDMSVEMIERTYGHLAPGKNERVLKAMDAR